MATVVFIVSGTSYTIPADWGPINTIEAIGGGQSGAGSGGGTIHGLGAYYGAISNEANTPGASKTIAIGSGGATGGDTTWGSSPTLVAPGGGSATSPVGSTSFAGGTGGGVTFSFGSGGGGGAGGPNGAGKKGGETVGVSGGVGGGGGGGAGGGSATNGIASTAGNVGGAGGTAQDGTAGGAGGAANSNGSAGSHGSGGGGGGASTFCGGVRVGGVGGNGVEWDATHGAGGGGGEAGGAFCVQGNGGNGGLYGGGGGGTGVGGTQGVGAQGIIVLTYAPFTLPSVALVLGAALIAANFASFSPWDYSYFGAAQPYTPRQLTPSIIAVPENDPPFQHPERTVQHTAIAVQAAQPDPWLYSSIGGAQPYMQRQLSAAILGVRRDNPPFGIPPPWLSGVTQAWQPDVWPHVFAGGRQAYEPRRLAPSITAVPENDPPFQHPSRWPGTEVQQRGYQPDTWPVVFIGGQQPYTPSRLNPTVTDVPVNDPPFTHPGRDPLANILITWQPEPWPATFAGGKQSYEPRKLSPGIPGQSVDQPPYRHPSRAPGTEVAQRGWQPEIWPYTFSGGWQPYTPRQLNPTETAVVETNPPFRHPGRLPQTVTAIWQWQPDIWPPVFAGGAQPYVPSRLAPQTTAVPENDPPFGIPNVSTLSAVVGEWQPDTWPPVFMGARQAYEGRKLSPGVPGQSIDDPPFQHPSRGVNATIVITATQPDPWVYTFMGGMQPFAPIAIEPGTGGSSVDNPPFRHPGRLQVTGTIVQQWQPPVWPFLFMGSAQPYVGRKLPPELSAVPPAVRSGYTIKNVVVRVRTLTGPREG